MGPTSSSYIDSLKCAACLEMYREPRTLPSCGHSVCSWCVQKLIANTTSHGNVVCPVCGVHSPVTENDFPRNYGLAGMIATLETAGYRDTSQCSACRSQVPNRELRECKTCATEDSLLLCTGCARHRHKDHDLVQFRVPPAPVPGNPSVRAVAPNPVTIDEGTPLPEDCCGHFMQTVVWHLFLLLCILVVACAVFLLCNRMGPLNGLGILALFFVIYGTCSCCLRRS